MFLDKQHPRPIYMQLKELLQNQIESGYYLSHQQLPSERDLCQLHSLSRMTARKALQALIADGFAYTKAGKGTFVKSNCGAQTNGGPKNGLGLAEDNNFEIDDYYRQKLLSRLLVYDSVGAEQVIHQALANHTLEVIVGKLFLDVIRYVEQKWRQDELSLLTLNFVITTLRAQLISMVNAATMPEKGPKVILSCAPGDEHEIGLLFLALSLRRRGFVVIYLGPGFLWDNLQEVIEVTRPRLLCFSAATGHAAESLVELSNYCVNHKLASTIVPGESGKPLLSFGGGVFTEDRKLRQRIQGLYLGSTIHGAVDKIQKLF